MLSGIISTVITSLISAIGGWLVRHFQEYWKDKQQATADQAKTAAATKALQDAKTKEEINNAAKGVADGF